MLFTDVSYLFTRGRRYTFSLHAMAKEKAMRGIYYKVLEHQHTFHCLGEGDKSLNWLWIFFSRGESSWKSSVITVGLSEIVEVHSCCLESSTFLVED